MRAYLIKANVEDAEAGCMVTVSRYAGTMADAREVRQTIVNDYDVKKKDVEVAETDIPTSKTELLAFINNLL